MTLKFITRQLGTISYQQGLAEQQQAQALVQHTPSTIVLLVCEHSPAVITLGRYGNPQSVITPPHILKHQQIEVINTTRGGDATAHFKGQLVVYPILSLKQLHLGVKSFVRAMELSMITTLRHFGIPTLTLDHLPGIWRQQGTQYLKLASLGFAVQRGVTSHGIALNISRDISMFDHIKPCGIHSSTTYGVSSVMASLPADSPWHHTPELTAEINSQLLAQLKHHLT